MVREHLIDILNFMRDAFSIHITDSPLVLKLLFLNKILFYLFL